VGDQRLVVVTTDQIDEVAAVATQIGLLAGGRLVSLGDGERAVARPRELLQGVRDKVWAVQVDPDGLVDIKRHHLISQTDRQAGETQLRVVSSTQPHPDALRVEPALIDAYVYYVQGGGRGAIEAR
jgi:hypothetical protein